MRGRAWMLAGALAVISASFTITFTPAEAQTTEPGRVYWLSPTNSLFPPKYQQSPTWDGATVNGQVRTGGWWKTLAGVYP